MHLDAGSCVGQPFGELLQGLLLGVHDLEVTFDFRLVVSSHRFFRKQVDPLVKVSLPQGFGFFFSGVGFDLVDALNGVAYISPKPPMAFLWLSFLPLS